MKDEGFTYVEIFFNGTRKNPFLNGLFICPIGDSTCPTTQLEVITLNYGANVVFFMHF